jgi:hypothetical protein
MTHVEQHKMIGALRDYEHKMKGKDSYDFEMFKKRDTDDEELDEQSRRRLIQLYEAYVPERLRR